MSNRNMSGCDDSMVNNNCRNNPIEECLFSLPPKQFALLSSLIGIALTENLDVNQQNALGNFLVNIGQAILTAAAQAQAQEEDNSQNDQINQEIDNLKNRIKKLECELEQKK